MAAFIEDRCVVSSGAEAKATPLYNAYKEWAEFSGERAENQRGFGMRLTERGFDRVKRGGVYYWLGIGLRHDGPGPWSGDGPAEKNPDFAGDSRHTPQQPGPSGPKKHITAGESRSRVVMSKKRPDGPNGPRQAAASDDSGGRLVEPLRRLLAESPEARGRPPAQIAHDLWAFHDVEPAPAAEDVSRALAALEALGE